MSWYRGKSLKKNKKKSIPKVETTIKNDKIKELISLLEEGKINTVKKFLQGLLPKPPKPKINFRELAESYKEELIKKATKAEKVAKVCIKETGAKFTFQHVIFCNNTFYIVDFFFPLKRLVIEIDGGYHNEEEQIKKDIIRTSHLKELGIEVVRYTNEEVFDTDNFRKQLTNLLKEE